MASGRDGGPEQPLTEQHAEATTKTVNTTTSRPWRRTNSRREPDQPGGWLLLVHQLPASPSRARVKAWRRLQQLGAVAIRNAVYVLPDSPQAREDFEWMKAEIVANKGEASVFAAKTIDALTRDDIIAAFREDRERLYKALTGEARKLADAASGDRRPARGLERRRLDRAVRQLQVRLAQIIANDFFRAGGRSDAEAVMTRLERLLAPPPAAPVGRPTGPTLRSGDYRRRLWVTRRRPGVDRCGSAWLIRRFVDPAARFGFSDQADVQPKAIPFDMYDVEFSHHGDRCTFEVLAERFGITDPAVVQVGHLVHDLDLKETRFNLPEASTVGRLIDGLRGAYARDAELLEHGIVLFEALYRAFTVARPTLGTVARRHQGRSNRKKRGQ